MMVTPVNQMTRSDVRSLIAQKKADIQRKIEAGETEERVFFGGDVYSKNEWETMLSKMDSYLEAVKVEQQERFAKMDEHKEQQEIYKKLAEKAENQTQRETTILKHTDADYFVPYSYMAEGDTISYNGVTFVCDEKHHAICLGDMSNPEDVINIPLTEGGCLKVNRNNFGDLSKAITMFSPEDMKRIMEAIALDAKVQQMKNEIEEDKNSLGDSADAVVANAGEIIEEPSKEQIALLFMDREKEDLI